MMDRLDIRYHRNGQLFTLTVDQLPEVRVVDAHTRDDAEEKLNVQLRALLGRGEVAFARVVVHHSDSVLPSGDL